MSYHPYAHDELHGVLDRDESVDINRLAATVTDMLDGGGYNSYNNPNLGNINSNLNTMALNRQAEIEAAAIREAALVDQHRTAIDTDNHRHLDKLAADREARDMRSDTSKSQLVGKRPDVPPTTPAPSKLK